MITLTHATGTLTLPADLEWTDEFAWTPQVAAEQRSLTGALIVHHSTVQSGRPITLASNGASWYPRAQVQALQALLSDTAAMTLALNGQTFAVIWRRSGNALPLEATPAYRLADPDGTHPYLITLRLMEI